MRFGLGHSLSRRVGPALIVAAALVAGAAPARAQAPLSCSAANAGQSVCQAEGICRCTYNAGGTMTREPAGYRWDCSLLYGKCTSNVVYPTLAGGVTPGPAPASGLPGGRASSAQIRSAQAELARLGFNPGPVDGVMGRRTANAIAAFQRSQRLPTTGTLNAETLSRLRVTG